MNRKIALAARSAAVGGGGAQPQRVERETAFRIISTCGAYCRRTVEKATFGFGAFWPKPT